MKLYIFSNILVDWTSGMAVAIANNKEEAIEILSDETKSKAIFKSGLKSDYIPKECFNDSVHCEERELNETCGYFVYGGS